MPVGPTSGSPVPRLVLPLTALLALVLGLLALPALAQTSEDTRCYDDPAEDLTDPDIVRLCVDFGPDRLDLVIEASERRSFTSSIEIRFDVDRDGVTDFSVPDLLGDALVDRSGDVVCEVQDVETVAGTLVVTVQPACLGSPDPVDVSLIYTSPGGSEDRVPDEGELSLTVNTEARERTADEVTSRRLSGADRFTTAVEISREAFPKGAGRAYLARADAFPDALAASALTGGPILLVPSCGELPAPVTAELRRLAPFEVVALGGPGAVCGILDAAELAAQG